MRQFLSLLSIVLGAVSAQAEIATNMTESFSSTGRARLFYAQGGDVYGVDCQPRVEVYLHSLCQINARHVDERKLFDALERLYGGGMTELSTQMSQVELGLNLVTSRLHDAITVTPTPEHAGLEEDLVKAEQNLHVKDGEVQILADQIARIEESLSSHEDYELREQLRIDQQKHAAAMQERHQLANILLAAQQRYIDAGVVTDQGLFQTLINEHRRLLARRKILAQELSLALKDRIALRQLFNRLHDNFTFIYILGQATDFGTHYIVTGPDGGRGVFRDGFNDVFNHVIAQNQ